MTPESIGKLLKWSIIVLCKRCIVFNNASCDKLGIFCANCKKTQCKNPGISEILFDNQ